MPRLRFAMRARAFRARDDRHTWRSLGWLYIYARRYEQARLHLAYANYLAGRKDKARQVLADVGGRTLPGR